MVPSTTRIMDSKRKSREEDATSPVMADYQKKRKIEFTYDNADDDDDNSNHHHHHDTNDDHGHDVVGETELASAFALASLASFSPQSTNHETSQSRPEAREADESEEDDYYGEEEESMASLEARSPKEEPIPITPDARSPIRPHQHHHHNNNTNNKRVTFAPNIKNHERLTARRFPIPSSSSPAARGSRMPLGFRRVPTRGPMPMPWARHRMMVPPPPPPGFLPPPAMMMPTSSSPSPHSSSSNQWICDFCNIASFATYEEACLHEEACSLRCSMLARPPPPPPPPSMWHPHASHSMPMQPSLRFPPPHEERLRQTPPPPQPLLSASSRTWYTGTTFLAVPESDAEWLSELNCFIRTTCVEAFSATAEHVSRTSKRGRITLHQVGIRCAFCAHRKPDDKAVASVSFPTSVTGIYESVKRWQRVHLDVCEDIPTEVRERLGGLATSSVWIPTTRQYWADSAKSLGMVDTEDGIRFGMNLKTSNEGFDSLKRTKPSAVVSSAAVQAGEGATFEEGKAIVYSEDLNLVPPYVYFLMSQVESCRFTEADRFVARSKGPVGYPGFQCRHCNGHAGLGKYFPVSSKSLATNSTSQNIHAHLLKCRKCPSDLKRQLVALKDEKSKAPRLEPGWRKVFFDKVWERMHGCSPEDGTRGL